MTSCRSCGAPITAVGSAAIRCSFCRAETAPEPKETGVPPRSEEASPPALEPRCPHCRRKLVRLQAAGVELDGCGACGGIWIDNAGAQHVVAYHEAVFAELAERAARNAEHVGQRVQAPVCAVCPATLDRATAGSVELDICRAHGTWFDAWELAQLVHAMNLRASNQTKTPVDSGRPTPGPRQPDLVRCAGCGDAIAKARANISPSGPKCDTCWRAVEDEEAGVSPATTSGFRASDAVDGVGLVVNGVGLLFEVLSALTD